MENSQQHPSESRETRPTLLAAFLHEKWWLGALVALLGLSGATATTRFIAAYVAIFAFLVTVGQGALFFVLLHHLVNARWSARASERMQRFCGLLRLAPILFIPIALHATSLFPWMHANAPDLMHHPAKAFYWGKAFFLARSLLYLTIWWCLCIWYGGDHQRKATNRELRQRRLSGPAMIVFGLTTIFAAFDWWMGLERDFYSGIFGIYVFAGAVCASLGLLAVVTAIGDNRTSKSNALAEERHDIGKLLFGFLAFWGYIAFCQYLIIWYAGIPHEMSFYQRREVPGWWPVTVLLVLSRFVFPFVLLISRNTKRSRIDLATAGTIAVLGHAMDMAWLTMPPILPQGPALGGSELAAVACGCLVLCTYVRSALAAPNHRAGVGSESASDSEPQPRHPRPLLPLGAHVSVLSPVRFDAGLMPQQHSTWKTVWVSLTCAVLAVGGGTAAAAELDARIRLEVVRKREVAWAQAAPIPIGAPSESYRWVDKEAKILRIPIDVARGLVIADYARRTAASRVAGTTGDEASQGLGASQP